MAAPKNRFLKKIGGVLGPPQIERASDSASGSIVGSPRKKSFEPHFEPQLIFVVLKEGWSQGPARMRAAAVIEDTWQVSES